MSRPFYARLAVWGFLLVALSYVLAGATGNLTGVLGAIPPFGIIAVVLAVLIRVTGRFLLVGLVFAILFALAFVTFGLQALNHIESFPDFAPALMRVIGSISAATGCSIARHQRRAGSLRPGTPAERRVMRVAAVALVALMAGSAAVTYTGSKTVDVGGRDAVLVITEGDEFVPSRFSFKPGASELILVRNRDAYAHTFSVDELTLDEYVGPRAEKLVRVRLPRRPGRFELYCAIIGHETMTGTINVR
jgi:cupredoxin-like protein